MYYAIDRVDLSITLNTQRYFIINWFLALKFFDIQQSRKKTTFYYTSVNILYVLQRINMLFYLTVK